MSSPRTSATIVALADTALIGVMGLGGVSVQLTGTWTGTITFEGTVDGSNWRALNMTASNASTPVTTATAAGVWFGVCTGLNAVRARASAWTSGTLSVTLSATEAAPGGGGGSGGGGGDGALLDGSDPGIKATVLDLTNSNPLAVRLSDANGDYVAAGAGTQYTEDDAAAADPVGGVTMLVRKDTPAAVTSTDGDNVAQRGTNKGEGYVKAVDTDALLTSLTAAVATETSLSAMAGDLGDSADAEASGNGSLIAITKKLRTILGDVKLDLDLLYNTIGSSVGIPGSSAPAQVQIVGGTDGTNLRALKTDTGGILLLPADPLGANADAVVAAGATGSLSAKLRRVTQGLEDLKTTIVLAAGSAAIGKLAANAGVDIGSVGALAKTSGGWTPYRLCAAGSDDATSVKGSAGQIGYIIVSNVNAAIAYLHIYNKATAPTLGSDTPVLTVPIPGNTDGAGAVLPVPVGIEFTTGIAFAITTTTGATPASGGVTATEVTVSLGYK